jgi:hypothetical protein
MTNSRSLSDPFGLLRGLASQLEKGLDSVANRGVRSDRVAKVVHKALGASLIAKNLRTGIQNRVLEALNLPSRSDILALGERLQSIEERVIGLSASLEQIGSGRPPARATLPLPAPPRTRRPPPEPVEVVATPVLRKRSKVRT